MKTLIKFLPVLIVVSALTTLTFIQRAILSIGDFDINVLEGFFFYIVTMLLAWAYDTQSRK